VGGGFAQLLAPDGFSARSANYGTVPKDADRVLAGPVPSSEVFGAKDWPLCGVASGRLERALSAVGVNHDVKEYPDAGHSFLQ
jgi:carboxymethylenebutenolidase